MVGKHSKHHRARRHHEGKLNWKLYAVTLLGASLVLGVGSLVAQQLTAAPSTKTSPTTQARTSQASQVKPSTADKTKTSQSSATKSSTKASSRQKTATKKSSGQASSTKKARKTASAKPATNGWTKQETPVKFPILTYHAIHDMAPEESANAHLIVSPASFESHIKALSEAGYYFLTPEEAHRVLTTNEVPAQKIVWVTFDGGHADVYTQAFPILKTYKAKATVNVIINPVITEQPASLTLAQLKEMKTQGLSFQSQGLSNADLAISYPEAQANELYVSKSWLDAQLEQETMVFTYPAGRYSADTVNFATQNYKLALTTNNGLADTENGLWTLNRMAVLPTMTAESLLASIQ